VQGVIRVATAAMKGEDFMTDFQFKALINLMIDVVRATRDPDKIIERLEAIRDGKVSDSTESKD
jgi:hypothetical protein